MSTSNNLILKIDNLRNIMHSFIEESQDLLNPAILSISREIDILLNQLYESNRQGQN